MLTGQEQIITLQMNSYSGRLTKESCRNILDRGWSGKLADSIQIIKAVRGGQSAVFDINEADYTRFMEVFQSLVKDQGSRIDFQIRKCTEMPDIENDYSGSAQRGGYNNNRGGAYESKSRGYGG